METGLLECARRRPARVAGDQPRNGGPREPSPVGYSQGGRGAPTRRHDGGADGSAASRNGTPGNAAIAASNGQ